MREISVKLSIKNCALTSFVTLGIRLEENGPKMENKQLVSPSRQCSSAPVGFGQGFLDQEQYDNTGASPIFS